MSDWMVWAALMVGAYFAGSIPFALLISKSRGVDIRKHGSGNVGATNVMRVLGKRAGITCFALDVLKGAAPVVIAGFATGVIREDAIAAREAWLWLGVAAAAILGHVFPVWLKFRGGKGVATGLGALAAVWPWLTLPSAAALVVWIVCQRVTRNVGFSSSVAAVALPLVVGAAAGLGLHPWDGGGS
ncbi:MAG: glycerol-3-phosphate acyltransferase, partial [Planctomycetota bacterium]|nr:glycerol-3-phosphate acyltransferase [Planctomycetota bacterium]